MKVKPFNKLATIGLLLCILLIISSCKVSRDVQPTAPGLPVNYRGATATDTAGVSNQSWQKIYTEVNLKRLIDTALVRNYDLQIAVKNIDAAQKVFSQSRLGYLPEVGLAVNANTNRPSDNSLNGLSLGQFLGSKHIEDYTAMANLSWEADIWGKVRNQKSAALAAYMQTYEARKAIQTQLVSQVSMGYYNLVMLDVQLDIAKQNVALNDSTLTIIKLQFDAGQVTSLAIQQAEAQQLSASKLIPQFEQEITIQENAISLLLGKAPESVVRTGSLDLLFPKEALKSGIPSSLLQQRPDVKNAELAITRANAAVGIQKANLYPALTISAQGGINSFKASDWFTLPASLFGNIAGGIVQPIFQKRKLKTQYELAKIEREKAVIQFRQQVLIAVSDVSDALVKIEKLHQQRLIADQRTLKLQQATKNANFLFRNGMANYLEVITAQSGVLESELNAVELKKAQLDASVALYRSLGGGWVN